MKPIKALLPLSVWLMRISLVLYAYLEYFKTFTRFHLDSVNFYIATLFLVFSVIIFITGFIKKTSISVISALGITLISVFNIVSSIDGGLSSTLVLNLFIASIAIYFLSSSSAN